MGRKYSDQQMIDAINATNGLIFAAAGRIGCEPSTIYDRLKVSPKVKQALDMQRGMMLDVGEAALMRAVKDGEGWAVCFLLKTLGKDRGYVERQEHTGAGGGALNVVLSWPTRGDVEAHDDGDA